ncbi:hypothetical protein HDV00_010587 [Rhizophlyctis rosea]|nr:hypothetical protein HDV00_010587 [Rhizophlyctis rosea]
MLLLTDLLELSTTEAACFVRFDNAKSLRRCLREGTTSVYLPATSRLLSSDQVNSIFPLTQRTYGLLIPSQTLWASTQVLRTEYKEAVTTRSSLQLRAWMLKVYEEEDSIWSVYEELRDAAEAEWSNADAGLAYFEEKGEDPESVGKKDKKGKGNKKKRKPQPVVAAVVEAVVEGAGENLAQGHADAAQPEEGVMREEGGGDGEDLRGGEGQERGEEWGEAGAGQEAEARELQELEVEEEEGWKLKYQGKVLTFMDVITEMHEGFTAVREELRFEVNGLHRRIDDVHRRIDDVHRRIDDVHRCIDDVHTSLNYDLEKLATATALDIIDGMGYQIVHSTRPYSRTLQFSNINSKTWKKFNSATEDILPPPHRPEILKYSSQCPRVRMQANGAVQLDLFAKLSVPGKGDLSSPSTSLQNLTNIPATTPVDPFTGTAVFEVTRANLPTIFTAIDDLKAAKTFKATNPIIKLVAKLVQLEKQVRLVNRHYKRTDAVAVAGLISPSFDDLKPDVEAQLLDDIFADQHVQSTLDSLYALYQRGALHFGGL